MAIQFKPIITRIGSGIGFGLLWLVWAWACGAVHFVFRAPGFLALLFILALPIAWFLWKDHRHKILIFAGTFTLLVIATLAVVLRPSNDRHWDEENRIQPKAAFNATGDSVTIEGIRAFKWRSREDYTPEWVDRTYQLAEATSLDLVIEPLDDSDYFAHSMLSFGFENGEHVVISVEVRREEGEEFGILPGIYGQFELMYQVLDERDALTLRALDPNSHLYIYPVDATPEFIRGLFVDLLNEANKLEHDPRFYHSLRANCTTKLFDHMNRVIDKPIKYRKEVLFPSMAGRLLDEKGWLKGGLPYVTAKASARAAERVRKHADADDFSAKIRE